MFTVSFYGASYIHLSVQEAKSATDISFRFRTHLPDAMLLLAAGRTDYCLIKLESGRLKVRIQLIESRLIENIVDCDGSRESLIKFQHGELNVRGQKKTW